MSVPALAERFGVSRSPVREAVAQAVRDGIAIEKPRRGTFVTKFEPGDLLPLFELREALEGMVARLAAERRTDQSMALMGDLLNKQTSRIAKGDLPSFVEYDMQLHLAIAQICQSAELRVAVDNLYLRLRVALSIRVAPTGPEAAVADHRKIIAAIGRGDSDAAEAAARTHVRNAMARLKDDLA
jgi:DNA-binding GntR family transcriptional regulator